MHAALTGVGLLALLATIFAIASNLVAINIVARSCHPCGLLLHPPSSFWARRGRDNQPGSVAALALATDPVFGVGIDGHCDMHMLAGLGPRPPQLLTNLEQLDGSIQWLARSVAAVSQSQPGEGIRLPEQDFRNLAPAHARLARGGSL